MTVINTNVTEKVIKFEIYSIILFGTYFRTTATKKWNIFNSCVCLNETSWKFPEGKFPPTVFYLETISLPEKIQREGTQRKKSTNRAKFGMK